MVVAVVAPLMGRDQKIDTSLPPFISPLVANTQISCPSTHFLFGCYPLLVAIIIIIFIFNLTYCFGGWINQTNKDVLLLSYSWINDWLLILLFWRETLNFLSVSFLKSKKLWQCDWIRVATVSCAFANIIFWLTLLDWLCPPRLCFILFYCIWLRLSCVMTRLRYIALQDCWSKKYTLTMLCTVSHLDIRVQWNIANKNYD